MRFVVRRQEAGHDVLRPTRVGRRIDDAHVPPRLVGARVPRARVAILLQHQLRPHDEVRALHRHLACAATLVDQPQVDLVAERHFRHLERGPVEVRVQRLRYIHLLRRRRRVRLVLEVDGVRQLLARLHKPLRLRIAKAQRPHHFVGVVGARLLDGLAIIFPDRHHLKHSTDR